MLLPFSGVWPFRRRLSPEILIAGYVVALGLVIVGSAFSTKKDGYFEGWSPRAVSINSPSVDPSASPGPVGALVGTDGTPAMAVVQRNAKEKDYELNVKDVPRAGAYVGGVDLLRGVEGGEATMTANVRDYWVWALLPIGLGIALGYWVTSYFTRRREQARQRVRLEELWDRITRAESLLALRSPDIWSSYSVQRRVAARKKEIGNLLASGEPENITTATKSIGDLDSYFDGTQNLWAFAESLKASAHEVARLINTVDLEVRGEEVPP